MKTPYQIRNFAVMSAEDAKAAGYESLTVPYHVDSKCKDTRARERDLWEAMCDQVKGCDCVVVEFHNGYEMWRHTDEMNIDPATGAKITRYITRF